MGALGSDSHRLPFQNKQLSDTERHTVHSMGLKPRLPPAPIRRVAGARMVSKSSYQGCSLYDALWERSWPSNNYNPLLNAIKRFLFYSTADQIIA